MNSRTHRLFFLLILSFLFYLPKAKGQTPKQVDSTQDNYSVAFEFFLNGDNIKTLFFCDSVIKLGSLDSKLFHLKAEAEINLNKDKEAMADLNKAIQLNPKFGEAFCDRGILFWSLKQMDKACKDWVTSKELGWSMAETFLEVKCQK